MAAVVFEIFDADNIGNVGCNITFKPQFPESALLYTNAQMLSRDIMAVLQKMSGEINNRQHHSALSEAIKL